MTDKELEARSICFDCLEREFNKAGKKYQTALQLAE